MKSVLIVGAGKASLESMAGLTRDPMTRVLQAVSGAQALEIAHRTPPDLLVCHTDLPDMHGFALHECWLADEQLCAIPFFFFPLEMPDGAPPDVSAAPTPRLNAQEPPAASSPHPTGQLPSASSASPHDLAFLYKTAMELVELPCEANIYHFIAERLLDLVGDAMITVTSFDSQSRVFTVETLLNSPSKMQPILNLFGKNPEGMRFPLGEEAVKRLYSRRMERLDIGLYDLAEGNLPRVLCSQIARLLNLGSVYAMGLIRGQELFGSASIYMPRGVEMEHTDTIETFIHQASVALQRRKAEEELHASERMFHAVVEQSRDGIVLIDEQGRVFEWNHATEQISGVERSAATGKLIWDILYPLMNPDQNKPEMLQMLQENIRDLLQHDEHPWLGPLNEMTIVRPDGKQCVMQCALFQVRTEEGFLMGCVLRDITERKQVEKALSEQVVLNASMADMLAQLLTASSLREISEVTLQTAQSLTSSPLGFVGYLDPHSGTMVTQALHTSLKQLDHPDQPFNIFQKEHGMLGWVMEHKQAMLSNFPEGGPPAQEYPHGHMDVRRILSVPALQGTDIVGQIAVANAERDYTTSDQMVLERLADLYALGIRRKLAEEELRETNEALRQKTEALRENSEGLHKTSEGLRKTSEALRQSEEKFRTLIEQSAQGVVLFDEQGAVIEWNQALQQISGLTRAEALGRYLWDLRFLDPNNEPQSTLAYQAMRNAIRLGLQTGKFPHLGEVRQGMFTLPDGSHRAIQHTSFPIKTDRGYRIGTVITDISERRWAEERRAMLYQATQEISASVNREQICAAIHKAVAQVMPVESVVITLLINEGREIEEVYLFDSGKRWPGERRPLGDGLSSYIITSGRSLRSENLNVEKLTLETQALEFGESVDLPLRAIAVPMRWADRTTGMLSVQSYDPQVYMPEDQEMVEMLAAYGAIAFENAAKTASLEQEIAEHRLALVELERLAKTDPLTGLLNRRHFFAMAEVEYKKASRYQRSLSVIMLDTDHFKLINDRYGHYAGDRALVALSDLLLASVREVDLVARYGGEEFVILLPETSAAGAQRLAERIREQVAAARIQVGERSVSFTISLGVADNAPDSGCTGFEQILVRADKALFYAKEHGRNRSISYSELLDAPDEDEP